MAANNSSTTKKSNSGKGSTSSKSGAKTRTANASAKGSGKASTSRKRSTSGRTGTNSGRKNTRAYEIERQREREEAMTPPETRREVYAIICFAINLLLMLGTYGVCGKAGTMVSGFFFGLFGSMFFVLPVAFFICFCFIMANGPRPKLMKKIIWSFVLAMCIGFVIQLIVGTSNMGIKELYFDGYSDHRGGGILFGGIIVLIAKFLSRVGAIIISFILIIISIIEITGVRPTVLFKKMFDFRFDQGYERYDEEYDDDSDDSDYYDIEDEDLLLNKIRGKGMLHDLRVLDVEGKSASSKKKTRSRNKKNNIVPDEEIHEIIPEVDTSRTKTATPAKYLPEAESEIAMPLKDRTGRSIRAEEGTGRASSTGKRKKQSEYQPRDFFELDPDSSTYDDPLGSDTHYNDESGEVIPGYKGPVTRRARRDREAGIQAESEPLLNSRQSEELQSYQNIGQTSGYDGYQTPRYDSYRGDSQLEELSNYQNVQLQQDYSSYQEPEAYQDNTSSYLKESEASKHSASRVKTASGTVTAQSESGRTVTSEIKSNERTGANSGNAAEVADDEKVTREDKLKATQEIGNAIENTEEVVRKYVFPPVSLLKQGGRYSFDRTGDASVRETAITLKQALESFGVNVTITNFSVGPSITRYELQPEQGVRVNKILGLENDIKMALAATDIRIEAPIPGKAAIGIEIPNKENQTVYFRDLIDNDLFREFKSNVAFAVGKDISGQIIISDIAKMPHLLIAGATGSGKSVCINTLIMSILYKADPKDVKLIMVDPKQVELTSYNGIPHLLIPVVVDPKKAAGALNWAVDEMTKRYQLFSNYGVRNIEGFNKKVVAQGPNEDPQFKHMPQLIVIVDELADLMMVAHKEVEESIVRLSQLARAAGIHLVIATQRPSVDVITGLIKANVPSRIAFSVSSSVDSRTIIDMGGAEKLLGKGDMLFYPAGYTKPVRVQGAFISDEEVERVVDFIKEHYGETSYDSGVNESINSSNVGASSETGGASDSESRYDELFEDAARSIIEKDKASIGYIQRMHRIGFNRAARIMDQLEEFGVVGPEEGTKPRKVLMTMTEFEERLDSMS